MVKLAFRNIFSKPLRSIATILAIAVVVAMTFCMISFKGAVYDYIYATETSAAGSADIVISTDSSSDRITKAEPLKALQEAKTSLPRSNCTQRWATSTLWCAVSRQAK